MAEDWQEVKSKSRDSVYYYNRKTGESVWQVPTKKQEHVSYNSNYCVYCAVITLLPLGKRGGCDTCVSNEGVLSEKESSTENR